MSVFVFVLCLQLTSLKVRKSQTAGRNAAQAAAATASFGLPATQVAEVCPWCKDRTQCYGLGAHLKTTSKEKSEKWGWPTSFTCAFSDTGKRATEVIAAEILLLATGGIESYAVPGRRPVKDRCSGTPQTTRPSSWKVLLRRAISPSILQEPMGYKHI